MSKLIDLTGSQIGSLKIVRRIEKHELEYDPNHTKYVCICLACGKDNLIMRKDKLNTNKKSHLGCINRKAFFENEGK